MKYKVWGVMALLAALVLSIAAPAAIADSSASQRYHQHLEAALRPEDAPTDGSFATHLPLLVIDTDDVEIPGAAILDEKNKLLGYTTTDTGESLISAQLDVMDSSEHCNAPTDTPTLSSAVTIRVRGNSSRAFDKKNYLIKLVDETGANAPQSLAGMDAHHEWVLHGPFLDKSLIRNYMWYNIAGEVMDYAPNVRFCELILNGEYMGLYVLTETITAGQDGSRLELTVSKKNNTYSGYCLRLDRGSSNDTANITSFTEYALRSAQIKDIVYPGRANLTEEMAEAIRQDFSDFEKALYSYDYNASDHGYETMTDVESFVDYFLLNELTCNYDAGWLSTYIYKGIDGRFRMCVWDFNSACDNYQHSFMDTQGFQMQNCLWYFMLMKEADFTDRIIERYHYLRTTVFSEVYLDAYIVETIAYLGPAIDRNFEKWGYTLTEEYNMLQPAERNPRSNAEAVEDMKDFLQTRIRWMDENIETLRQYSADSKVKKFNEHTD